MSHSARRLERQVVAPVPPPEAPKPIEEKKVHPFAQWWKDWNAGKPDWTYEGFEAACNRWLEFCSTKDCHHPLEMMEFLAHKIASDLRQKKVEVKWIMTDKVDGRPYVKITMGDRWVFYHDVAVTIPKMP